MTLSVLAMLFILITLTPLIIVVSLKKALPAVSVQRSHEMWENTDKDRILYEIAPNIEQ